MYDSEGVERNLRALNTKLADTPECAPASSNHTDAVRATLLDEIYETRLLHVAGVDLGPYNDDCTSRRSSMCCNYGGRLLYSLCYSNMSTAFTRPYIISLCLFVWLLSFGSHLLLFYYIRWPLTFTDCSFETATQGNRVPFVVLSPNQTATEFNDDDDDEHHFSVAFFVTLVICLLAIATLVALIVVVVQRIRSQRRQDTDSLGPISAVSLGDIDRRVGSPRRRVVKRKSAIGSNFLCFCFCWYLCAID